MLKTNSALPCNLALLLSILIKKSFDPCLLRVSGLMERIAIPIFQARISPVLDACQDLLVVDIEGGKTIRRMTLSLADMPLLERGETIARRRIDTLICAGISDLLSRYLAGRGIHLISGIAGDVDRVINAYCHHRLSEARFQMPGRRRPYPPDAP
jgi:predicted Fe-Mo cluster-binding NifX family protein